ncbi:capping protein-inhibiting regulator of actin dynamics isoform X2 [Dasypus novemcinctus]|nr:capping protein-inhibiting regulator of actin dynamics isoform X2 [Dasypus novemcinctus]XP_058154048.1 capping protein-inhibiting regulator of actin dynamics isoform X2 [Dasypus novemcinctus]XP_058154049.1 capping protein-inhibiting regulator of actin dynamics isoform X2 [Dasypus novemcinctus]
MGTRAFSHDSIFIPDGGAESEQTIQAISQDNILGKVKTLQQQLGKNIKFGQPPPSAIPMKKADGVESGLEEDLFLTSPMDIVTQQDIVLSDTENKSSDTPSSLSPLNLPGARSEMEEKVAPVKPSRPKRHLSSAGTIESVDLDAIPLAIARLDNSAAKHKLAVKPKNQRVSKKHRHLAQDQRSQQGGLESQPSLDQNGHPGEDKPMWHEEEPEPLDPEEEKRRQEEYWRELEAKCKRQKAEAAEKRRLEEQRLQALERRLWEENRRQQLLEKEEEEGGKEEEPQLEAETEQQEEERETLEGGVCQDREWRELEAEEQKHLEAQRLEEELEAQRRQEAERQRQEEERQLKERRQLEELEEQRRQEAERRLEELRQQEEEEQRRREEDEKWMKELKRQEDLEEQRRQEAAAKQLQEEEEEAQRREELRKQEMKEKRRQEEQLQEEEEAGWERHVKKQEEMELRRWQEAKKEHKEVLQRPKEESQLEREEKRGLRGPLQNDVEEKPEEQENVTPKTQRESSQLYKKQNQEVTALGAHCEEDHPLVQEKREHTKTEPPSQKKEGQAEETPTPVEKKEAVAPKTDRKVEELRWQEVDERQTMPRPYTFQVSSGGKQILFPKVNLSPVTPARDAGPASAAPEPQAPRASPAAPALASSLSVPHTAILVTGAQLCGPAVNLSQIKDTACKSLLGLSEEKKQVEPPALETPPRSPSDARAGPGKARPAPEASSSAAALAEWASIRSRILRTAEGEQRGDGDLGRPGEEHAPRGRCDSRGNPRKTPPMSAKFSIMPAWQKFSDGGVEPSKQSTEAEGIRKRAAPGPSAGAEPQPVAAGTNELRKSPEKAGVHQAPADTSEGCKFAKDLPSFLVPSLPYPPQRAGTQSESSALSESETPSGTGKPDHVAPGGEEKASPFGIKLRRTNYSLRFHCDQQKKKRHSSTGDGADGGAPAPGSTNGEKETGGLALKPGRPRTPERKPAPSESPCSLSAPAPQPAPPPPSGQAPAPDHDKAASKMPLAPKPALAPKPTGQTPPPSPLCKLSRPYLVELLARRAGKPDAEPSERAKESQQSDAAPPPSPPAPEERKGQKRDEEEEATERKPPSPAVSATRQEKPTQTLEAGRKEKPMLQSRHSLDGTKLMEKVETAQPLWITLALQKQRGFREQQATREERKQAREAKQAEKLSKENVTVTSQPGSSSVSRAGSLHKSTPQLEEKKPESAVSRLERREQLKKANTLPTSVTVEISDSAPPAPLVKEVTKRFSTPDAAPVSTEPAWLALAKRKAKAWSDCPQIIK